MLLSRVMPAFDAIRAEHRVINGSLAAVYDAAVATDFLDAVRLHPIVRLLFTLRSAGGRVACAIRRRPFEQPPEPASLVVNDMPLRGEWVRIAVDPPFEFVFGAIGRFWAGETIWRQIDGSEFGSFNESGFAKIGCRLAVRPLGHGRTLLTYEARTLATDEASRRAFLRYWRVVSPFVGFIMRATLAVIARNVAAGVRPAPVRRSAITAHAVSGRAM